MNKLLLLLRSFILTLCFPLTVIILGPTAIVLHFLFQNKKVDDFMMIAWGSTCCRMFGVRVEVEGLENIPQTRGCLFLFNHSSFFDIFALAGYIPGLRFGAKAELFKIPIFGKTMEAMGTLPIARNNREEVYKVYDEAKKRFSQGEKFALAPEGGRFFGPEIFPFKAGPFIFAMSAEAPLVPVVILGANECLPKGAFLFNKDRWSRKIYLKILKPIESKGYAISDRNQLQKQVYEVMNPIWIEDYKKRN